MARLGKRVVQAFGRRFKVAGVLPLSASVRIYGGTDKQIHGYTEAYRRHLAPHRYRRNRVIEIGVGGWTTEHEYASATPGGSLRVWRDYLPRSVIVGMDIEEKEVALGHRVRFVRGDQSNRDDLARAVEALGGPPNIVIDDGSHLAGHARASFDYLFPRMPIGAIYVVEDLHTSFYEQMGGASLAPPSTAIGLAMDLVTAVQDQDSTFDRRPNWGARPPLQIPGVAELHVYPGVFFVIKAASQMR